MIPISDPLWKIGFFTVYIHTSYLHNVQTVYKEILGNREKSTIDVDIIFYLIPFLFSKELNLPPPPKWIQYNYTNLKQIALYIIKCLISISIWNAKRSMSVMVTLLCWFHTRMSVWFLIFMKPIQNITFKYSSNNIP